MTLTAGFLFFGIGLVLGAIYFYLLRLTIQFLSKVKRPMRLLLWTTLARFILIGCIFYFILQNATWYALLLTGFGFWVQRTLILYFERKKGFKK
ncbi:MAG: N-ATPase subunit AtpR [Alphaproteobacteria bacterium]